MIFEEYVKENKEAFIKKVIYTANFLEVEPEHEMFVMWFESRLDHRAVNYQKGDSKDPFIRCKKRATGLIQFMPATSRMLGTTNLQLLQMSNVEQMEYVQRYLGMYKGKYTGWLDLYCSIFYPAAIGKPDTFRITTDIVAKQNPLFDINKDMDITKAEIRFALIKQIPEEYKHLFT